MSECAKFLAHGYEVACNVHQAVDLFASVRACVMDTVTLGMLQHSLLPLAERLWTQVVLSMKLTARC